MKSLKTKYRFVVWVEGIESVHLSATTTLRRVLAIESNHGNFAGIRVEANGEILGLRGLREWAALESAERAHNKAQGL